MFGIWLNKKVYENLPPMFFLFGLLTVFSGVIVPNATTASLVALGGVALMIAAFNAVVTRNKHRKKDFSFKQLFAPARVEEVPTPEAEEKTNEFEIAFGISEDEMESWAIKSIQKIN